ncbi:MAG TPA: YdcF family protein, partial [Desulfobacteraceae bacterium]|nr:YdcF family protein [Desulfobacteraceae bacterium]
SHPLEKADLVVCLGGSPVERGLEAAELLKEGYAPRIFISREQPPESLDILRARGVDFPESHELTYEMLEAFGLPPESLIISDDPVSSTAEEAEQLRRVAIAEGFSHLIVVTSPQHSRRAWIAFRHMFKDSEVSVSIRPTRFSGFEPERWWKEPRYARRVILEYMKILWYLWIL